MFKTENAFLSALIHLKETDNKSNIWSQTVCRAFQSHNFNETSYTLGQVLEPSILYEVSTVTNIPIKNLIKLDYVSDGPIKLIQNYLTNIKVISPIEKLNVAYSLTALSRCEYALHILQIIDSNQLSNEDKIHYYLLQFILKNRLDINSYETEFQKMKVLLEENNFSDIIQLKISTQAIVWQMKQKRVSEELFKWYVKKGLESVKTIRNGSNFKEHIALSNFYRAYAMIPADNLLIKETRIEMEKALYYANISTPNNELEKYRKLDSIKTCYESELKEHLYLSKNYTEAERAGFDLINLDPNWSISYHEMADLYLKLDKTNEALAMFEKSKEIGLPRITYTHFMMGYCLNTLNRKEESLFEFIKTLEMDSTNISAGINGYNIAKELNHNLVKTFKTYLDRWEQEGILENEHKEYLASI